MDCKIIQQSQEKRKRLQLNNILKIFLIVVEQQPEKETKR